VEDGVNNAGLFGVEKAVKEFVDKHEKEVMSSSTRTSTEAEKSRDRVWMAAGPLGTSSSDH
jgi:hypothetical protein